MSNDVQDAIAKAVQDAVSYYADLYGQVESFHNSRGMAFTPRLLLTAVALHALLSAGIRTVDAGHLAVFAARDCCERLSRMEPTKCTDAPSQSSSPACQQSGDPGES
jgi:hypothetical protein